MRAHLRPLLALLVSLIPSTLWGQSDGARELNRALERLAKGEQIAGLPTADSVSKGPLTVPFGTTRTGTAVAQGPIVVLGTVEGSVVSLGSDVTIRAGGHVTGDVLSVGGQV